MGERFKESVYINSGLLALGNVISALADSKKKVRGTYMYILPKTSCCSYYHRVLNLPRNKFQCCKLQQYVALSRPEFYFLQHFFILATLKFVAWKVEHAVVVRATTRSICNATMLRDKLKENADRITWPLGQRYTFFFLCIMCTFSVNNRWSFFVPLGHLYLSLQHQKGINGYILRNLELKFPRKYLLQ